MHFVHLGCWNKGLCEITKPWTNGVSGVMNSIQTYVADNSKTGNPVDFMVLAGDNYYPEKTDSTNVLADSTNMVSRTIPKTKKVKEKTFVPQKFNSGFECLSHIYTKKYILFGNHEHDTYKDKKCLIFEKTKNKTNSDEFVLFKNVLTYEHEPDKTIVIMIDTTMYEQDVDYSCYNEDNYKFNITGGIATHRQKQQANVNKILENNKYNKFIFIGHHPIASIKQKKSKNKTEFNDNLVDFFLKLQFKVDQQKIYYLCADTHFYQKSTITINDIIIEQHIVGTGGADLDTVTTSVTDNTQTPNDDKLNNSINNMSCKNNKDNSPNIMCTTPLHNTHKFEYSFDINEQKTCHGYLIYNSNSSPQVVFKPVQTNQNGDGYKQKYLSYKKKYLLLKKHS